MRPAKPENLSLVFNTSLAINDFVDVTDFVSVVKGKIVIDDATVIGSFQVTEVDIEGALDTGFHPFDVFDTSASLSEYFHSLFDAKTLELKASIWNQLKNPIQSNILIIDRIELHAGYRGLGIGSSTILRLCAAIGKDCGIAVLKAFPLQFESSQLSDAANPAMQLDNLSTDIAKSTKKLKDFYAAIGFETIRRTPFMGMSLELRSPTAQSSKWGNPREFI